MLALALLGVMFGLAKGWRGPAVINAAVARVLAPITHVLRGAREQIGVVSTSTERIEACLALYLIVAWRVLHVLMLGRECPEMRCDAVLSEAEWREMAGGA